MSKIETRPVAEIIGWRAVCRPTPEPIFICWHKPNGEMTTDDPTADDMLVWLREQGYDIEMGTAHDASEVGVEVSAWDDCEDCDVVTDHFASTLHAALEAAVRAVDEARQ